MTKTPLLAKIQKTAEMPTQDINKGKAWATPELANLVR
jgi:hypothetical protein